MNNILIEPVLNGWKVQCGCQQVVFTDVDKLCGELKAYLTDPQAVQKRYLHDSVNAKWSNTPQMAEAPQCEAAMPARDDTARVIRNPNVGGLLRGNG